MNIVFCCNIFSCIHARYGSHRRFLDQPFFLQRTALPSGKNEPFGGKMKNKNFWFSPWMRTLITVLFVFTLFTPAANVHAGALSIIEGRPLGAPSGISPNNISVNNPITLTWQADPAADRYWLWVDDQPNWKEWDDNTITPAGAGCTGGSGSCAYTLPVNLTDGSKQWWVLAFYGQSGHSGWSTPLSFSVNGSGSGGGIPGAGVGISPSGTTENNPITLTWQADSAAARYWLWVNDNAGLKEWDQENVTPAMAGCGGGSGQCAYTLPTNLTDGNKQWWVLPIGSQGGSTAWSAPLYFTVSGGGNGGGTPGPGVGISPSGTTETNPVTLTWQADPAAAHYWLWIEMVGNGEEWNDQNITTADAGCVSGTGTCSYTLPVNLTNGNKVWWVLPTGSQGEAVAWSPPLYFSIGGGSGNIPGRGVLINPVDITVSNPVTLTWQVDPIADRYQLILFEDEDALVDIWLTSNEAGCGNGACQYAAPWLENGTYAWKVLPSNGAGNGTWSPRTNFTVSGGAAQVPGQVTGISPSGSNVNNPITLTWQAEPNAAYYWLWVDHIDQGIKEWENTNLSPDEAGCAGGNNTCAFTLPINLQDGSHQWWILAGNNIGQGPWSSPLYFQIGQPAQPEPPSILSPQGDYWFDLGQELVMPIAEWTPVPGTETYMTRIQFTRYDVYHPVPPAILYYSPAELGCADEVSLCTVSLSYYTALANREYTFSVSTTVNGQSLSASTTFELVQEREEPCELGKGMPLSPNGNNVENPVTFTWQEDACNANAYHLVIENTYDSGPLSSDQFTCNDAGVCSFTPDITLDPGQYTWSIVAATIWPRFGATYGEWSDPVPFTVSDDAPPEEPCELGKGMPLSPNGINAVNPVTFTWQADACSANAYQLVIENAYNQQLIYGNNDYTCNDAGVCSFNLDITLDPGQYTWKIMPMRVNPRYGVTYGMWSDPVSFTLSGNP
jgi:hypothetical protein